MKKCISHVELSFALNAIYQYLDTNNKEFLVSAKESIKKAKEIDYSVRTHEEFAAGTDCIPSTHSVNRMGVFSLNSFDEFYFGGGLLTIYDDDPYKGKIRHINTYRLTFNNEETHYNIYEGNPKAEDKPYDFIGELINQITIYQDGKCVNTTLNAYDSFSSSGSGPGYRVPVRTFDFKSALWNSEANRNHHGVDYIIQLEYDGQFKVFRPGFPNEPKQVLFIPANHKEAKQHLEQYQALLKNIKKFEHLDLNWDRFILEP